MVCGLLFTQPCLNILKGYSGCGAKNRLKWGTTGSLVRKTRWLIFMCQLDWVPGYLDIWSSVILGVSVQVFLGEMHISIVGLRKADCPPQCGWASSNQLKALRDKNKSPPKSKASCLQTVFRYELQHQPLPEFPAYQTFL